MVSTSPVVNRFGGNSWIVDRQHREISVLAGEYSPPAERSHVAPWRQLADRWALCEHAEGLLLHGKALDEAESWAATNPDDLSDVDQDFLAEARRVEAQGTRGQKLAKACNCLLITALLSALVLARLLLGAREETARHMSAALDETMARATAEADATSNAVRRANAEATRMAVSGMLRKEREESRLTMGRMLAANAQVAMAQDRDLAILLAVHGLRQTRTYVAGSMAASRTAAAALYRALGHEGWEYVLDRDASLISGWASPTGAMLTDGIQPEIYDLGTGRRRCELVGMALPLLSASWSHHGHRVLTVDAAGDLAIWDAETGGNLLAVRTGRLMASAVWSADGQRLLAIDHSGKPSVWSAQDGLPLALAAALGATGPVAWSNDGTRLAAPDEGGHLAVWDEATGAKLLTLDDSRHDLARVRWTNYDSEIEGWNGGGELEARLVWGANTGQRLIDGHLVTQRLGWDGAVSSFRMSAKVVAGGSFLLFAAEEDLIAYAHTQVTRDLTQAEWQRYFGTERAYSMAFPELPTCP